MTWVKGHWIAVVAGAALFFVGIGIGAAGSASEDDAEPAGAVPNVVTEVVTESETVDPTDDQLRALEERAAALEDRTAALRQRERGVAQRERALRRAERVIGRSTFGDGVYLVGEDVPPGSYLARGGGDCYWARLEDGSQDIIDNHIGTGQVRVTINAGELFETQGCGTWRRG